MTILLNDKVLTKIAKLTKGYKASHVLIQDNRGTIVATLYEDYENTIGAFRQITLNEKGQVTHIWVV